MSGALTEAVNEGEFARLMEKYAPFSGRFALAVSGGPDSMALAFCVKRWAERDCIALIVEHGLRPESAAEATQVKQRLQNMGIPAEILPWKHEDGLTRLHEKAREARYALLLAACHRLGAKDLLTAHHREDQAETILMRLAKGSGIDGLAGIPAQTVREGVRLLRPFLATPKERLKATCEAAGITPVTDSSNKSEKYARGRLRKIMPLLASEGLTVESLTNLSQRARDAKDALDHATHEFLKTAAKTGQGGTVRLDRNALRAAPREIAFRALAASLRYVHNAPYPPEHAAMTGLIDTIIGDGKEQVRTLYGCLASVAENHVTLLREPVAATEALPLPSGATILWDDRWLVTSDATSPASMIRALGLPPHDLIDSLAPDLRHKIPQGRIRASLPALWDGGILLAIPSFDECAPFRMAYGKQTFP